MIILQNLFEFDAAKQIRQDDGNQYRRYMRKGSSVLVVKKEHQRTGELTKGIVDHFLTSSMYHPRGIKVRLQTGVVGRVQHILKY